MAWPKGIDRKLYVGMRAKGFSKQDAMKAALPGASGKVAAPKAESPRAGKGKGRGKDDKRGNGVEKDPVNLQLLALYTVQKLGQGSLEQIHDQMVHKLGMSTLHKHSLEIALDALRKRGYASANHGRTDEGEVQDLWSIRDFMFQKPPEVAHYSDVLPELLKTPEAQAIKSGLDDKENKGEAKKKRNQMWYADYYMIRATFRTLDLLLGAMPVSPYQEAICKDSEVKIDATTFFDRDPNDGAYVISADQVGGWLRSNSRYLNKSDVSGYVGTAPAKIYPKKGEVIQAVFPIIAQGGRGGGLAKYEAIRAGVEFTLTFTVPAKGVLPHPEFRAFLMLAGLQPLRGISPARGKRYGRILLTNYEVIEDLRQVHASLATAIEGNVSEDLRAQYKDFINETLAGSKRIYLASKAASTGGDDVAEA